MAIKYPLKSGLFCTKRNVLYSIAMIWVFNGSFAVPYGLHEVFPVFPDCPAYICAPKDVVTFGMHSWFKMTEFFVYYLIPMVIIFFVYCEILKELCTVTRENPRRSSAEQGRKAKRRVVMMLLSSVVIYFISYSPVQLFFLANRFFGHYEPGPITILICNALT